MANIWDIINPYYLFPLTNQSELKTRSVSWNALDEKDDSTRKVRESFWMWNKDIPHSADSKVHNTAKILDFFKMHYKKKSE
jgi:hypothetical protein